MQLIEHLEATLAPVIALLEWLLEAIAALCVLLGLIRTLQLVFRLSRRRRMKFPFLKIRIGFGIWLALALEFQLGADILATTITPTLEALARLAAIAIIRTFLNYFLNKELETIYDFQESGKHHMLDFTE